MFGLEAKFKEGVADPLHRRRKNHQVSEFSRFRPLFIPHRTAALVSYLRFNYSLFADRL